MPPAMASRIRPELTPTPATFAADSSGTAQSLNISRAMRESSEIIAGRVVRRFGLDAASLDVTTAALKLAPIARTASAQRSAGLRRLQRHCRSGGEQHLLFGDQDQACEATPPATVGRLFDHLRRSAE